MGVGIVVHHQVNGLHVSLGRHREVALDDHRNDAPILRRDRHVQGDVPALDGPAGRDFPQNPRDLLVGDLGVGIPGPIRQEAALIQQRAGGYQTTGGKEGRAYTIEDIDVFALVALDRRQVAFISRRDVEGRRLLKIDFRRFRKVDVTGDTLVNVVEQLLLH